MDHPQINPPEPTAAESYEYIRERLQVAQTALAEAFDHADGWTTDTTLTRVLDSALQRVEYARDDLSVSDLRNAALGRTA
jgi:hypothetical protein